MMPSRKRNKGRARRVKKNEKSAAASEAAVNDNTHSATRQEQRDICRHRHRHGDATAKTRIGVVCIQFIEEFLSVLPLHLDARSVSAAFAAAVEKYPQAITDDANREHVLKFFVGLGVESVLDCMRDATFIDIGEAVALTLPVFMLENYPDVPSSSDNKAMTTLQDTLGGCPRTTTQFFRERAPCSCLDQIYSELKSQPKIGPCHGCFRKTRRSRLLFCAGCDREQYCGAECQRRD